MRYVRMTGGRSLYCNPRTLNIQPKNSETATRSHALLEIYCAHAVFRAFKRLLKTGVNILFLLLGIRRRMRSCVSDGWAVVGQWVEPILQRVVCTEVF